jgi:hypothetical protein
MIRYVGHYNISSKVDTTEWRSLVEEVLPLFFKGELEKLNRKFVRYVGKAIKRNQPGNRWRDDDPIFFVPDYDNNRCFAGIFELTMSTFSKRDRLIIELRRVNGWSYKAIGAHVNLSATTIRRIDRRGIADITWRMVDLLHAQAVVCRVRETYGNKLLEKWK